MNPFRKNKKPKNNDQPSEGSRSFTNTFKSSKKNKKDTTPNPEPNLDLSHALPSDDDFRTSLIMPKLSARFSMLREQDDPATKVGKASDDSVISPKRASRLNVLGLAPTQLPDIDEVDSIVGRNSFARSRAGSSASGAGNGYGPDENDHFQLGSSVMKRSRPVEGNNLFGGRQKVFKIPVKQLGPDGETGRSGMNGRTFYENDLPLSAFQRLRLEGKDESRATAETPTKQYSTPMPEPEETTSDASANRTTYSSTASGPSNSRVSTAATSVDENDSRFSSDGPAASSTKSASNNPRNASSAARSRRLYGHGLAQAAQDQQSSTLHRLESLSRQRAGTPELKPLNRSLSRSSPSLRDRLHKLAIAESSLASSRPASPSLSATSSNTQQRESDPFKEAKSATSSVGRTSPLGPPIAKNDENSTELAAAINPEDRGKATAMGLFNKPKTAFDEFQFMHRQIKLRQNAQTPPLTRPSPGNASTQNQQQQPVSRPRGNSTVSARSGAAPSAASLRDDAEHAVDHSTPNTRNVSPSQAAPRGTFFGSSSSSSSDSENDADANDDADVEGHHSRKASTMLQESDGVRPGFQSGSSAKSSNPARESQDRLPEVRLSELADLKPIAEDERTQGRDNNIATSSENELRHEKPDSPTLGPTGRLSGLVRSHLRQDSDNSTMLPPPVTNSPSLGQRDSEWSRVRPVGESLTTPSTPSSPSTRDLDFRLNSEKNTADNVSGSTAVSVPRAQPSVPNNQNLPPRPTPPFVNREPVSAARSLKDSQVVTRESSFEDEINLKHRRDVSTETQREREDFARELAERRRKVEEKLRSISETESRSGSPVPRSSSENQQVRPGNAFSILKNKPNRSPTPARDDQRNQNALGLGSGNASTPALLSEHEHSRHDEEDRMPYGSGKHSNSSTPHIAMRSRKTSIGRSSHEDELRKRSRSLGRVASPSIQRTENDRSGLYHDNTPGPARPDSHSKQDDTESSNLLEGVKHGDGRDNRPFSSATHHDQRNSFSVPSSARPSVERLTDDVHYKNDNNNDNHNNSNCQLWESSTPATSATSVVPSGRFRSGSRPTTASSQVDKSPHTADTHTQAHSGDFSMVGVTSPRPSPIPSYCANPTPSLYDLAPDSSTRAQSFPSGANGDHGANRPNSSQRGITKRAVNKLQISQPIFFHSTSDVPVVGLPAGANMKNDMQKQQQQQQQPPPVPPMNPRRRRQTTTHNFFGGFRTDKNDARDALFSTNYIEDQSLFTNDDTKAKVKRKLRKMSSEGGGLNQRTRTDSGTSTMSRPFYSPHAPPPFPPPQALSRHTGGPHYPPVPPTMEGGMI